MCGAHAGGGQVRHACGGSVAVRFTAFVHEACLRPVHLPEAKGLESKAGSRAPQAGDHPRKYLLKNSSVRCQASFAAFSS
jgi:hypothetical protein